MLVVTRVLTVSFVLSLTLSRKHVVAQHRQPVKFPNYLPGDHAFHQTDGALLLGEYKVDEAYQSILERFEGTGRNLNHEPNSESAKSIYRSRDMKLAGFYYTFEFKVRADLEQLEYLVANNLGNVTYYTETVIPKLQKLLERIPSFSELEKQNRLGMYHFQKEDFAEGIHEFYNKALYRPNITAEGIDNLFGESFNPEEIETKWFHEDGSEDKEGDLVRGPVIVIDDFFSPEALTRIRNLLLQSTAYFEAKPPSMLGTYCGAYINDGLNDKILLEVSDALRKALPRILGEYPLKLLWSYKYFPEYDLSGREDYDTGINVHADNAAVNLNIWLTPDEANLDPDSGGLVVYTVKPPFNFDYTKYNDARVKNEILEKSNWENITVPYKYNRATLFDSALYHKTDKFQFKTGYENRRINLTLLFGDPVAVKKNTKKSDEL